MLDDVDATVVGFWYSGGCGVGLVQCYGPYQRWTNVTDGTRSFTWTPTLRGLAIRVGWRGDSWRD